jgi:hypothetical protein
MSRRDLTFKEKVVSVAGESTCLTSDMEIKGDLSQNELGSFTYRPSSLSLFFFFFTVSPKFSVPL